MKKIILMAVFMPYLAYGQIVEKFETGTLTNWNSPNPERWKADQVTPLAGSFSLHHVYDNPDAGFDRIGVRLDNFHPTEGTTVWTFSLRHGFDPSSTNNWMVFLMSDVPPGSMSVSGATNGYAIGVNITGFDDSIRLVKIKNGILKTVVSAGVNWQTQVGMTLPAEIKVTRTAGGNWTVGISKSSLLISEKSGLDAELFNPAWFGLCYKYTSTKDRLLWMDDVSVTGPFFVDYTAPGLVSCVPSSKRSLKIKLDEAASDSFLIAGNFLVNPGLKKPARIIKDNSLEYTITFDGDFKNRDTNRLVISKICDRIGNCSSAVGASFFPVWAETGDVVISEIMADPFPSVSLPEKEYIEITNLTGYSFSVGKWKLKTTDQDYLFPVDSIRKNEILILTSSSSSGQFEKYGRTHGFSQFPVLNDDGKLICIQDSTGSLIHGVDYSSDWYGEALKKGGGWSLEMIDPSQAFFAHGNWKASADQKGGTPGKINSVNKRNADTHFKGLLNVFPLDSKTLTVSFSESVPDSLLVKDGFLIDSAIISKIEISDLLFRTFTISLSNELEAGKIYTLRLTDQVKDFAGNKAEKTEFKFGLTEKASPGDMVFNELLFNPFPGYPDYIEFYNNSRKILNPSRLMLAGIDDAVSDTSRSYVLSSEARCILPGTYYVVTTHRDKVIGKYISCNPESIFQVSEMPSMPDDKGHLVLYNRELEKIDEVKYDEKMHSPLLRTSEGVALCKLNPADKSLSESSWHTAADSSGRGSPGIQNVIEKITSMEDTIPPLINSCIPVSKNSIRLTINEGLNSSFASSGNIIVMPDFNSVQKVTMNSPLEYVLTFTSDFTNRDSNTLIIKNLCDIIGNCRNISRTFVPVWAEQGDVVISEIMADPEPPVSLPGKEYLEIINLSSFSFSLKNWELRTPDQEYSFPDDSIRKNEILILSSSSARGHFEKYGRTLGFSQFPILTDDGKTICIYDNMGSLIDGVEYSSVWYGEELKKNGGWSLEKVDCSMPFHREENWVASSDSEGGTPGKPNSRKKENPDNTFEGLENVFAIDSRNIILSFSETVKNFSLSKDKIQVGEGKIKELSASDILYTEYKLMPETELKLGEQYTLSLPEEVKDFAGNIARKREMAFGLTTRAAERDITFNELLFNPYPGEPDFIEFVNTSDKIIDASRLLVVSIDDNTADTSGIYPLSRKPRCILPGSYYAITTDRQKLLERFPSADGERIFELSNLPSMSDDKGHLVLYNRELEKIDEVFYTDKMHFALLVGKEGVSLEKIGKELESTMAGNWHSASESAGWGTPGNENSTMAMISSDIEEVSFSSTRITPDSDGNDDFLTIGLNAGGLTSVVSISVFDETGTLVRRLVSNILSQPGSTYVWDGSADDGTIVRKGIYVLLITMFDDAGKTWKWKKVCSVIY